MDIELTGNYPIIIDGKETGSIDVSRDGLFWCFEATSEDTGGIIRLSVFGDGGEGYLGVMEPKDNHMRLKKKLSRSGLKGFPHAITHGGKQGEAQLLTNAAPSIEAAAEAQAHEAPPIEPAAASSSDSGSSECEADNADLSQQYERPPPEKMQEHPHEEEAPRQQPLIWRMCGCPASYLSSVEGKNIFGAQSNVLEASDGEHLFLALPEKNSRIYPEQQRLFTGRAVIMGESYLICKTKNGKII